MNEVVLMKLQIKCATFCIAHHKTIFPISALSEIGLGTVISSVYILLLLELWFCGKFYFLFLNLVFKWPYHWTDLQRRDCNLSEEGSETWKLQTRHLSQKALLPLIRWFEDGLNAKFCYKPKWIVVFGLGPDTFKYLNTSNISVLISCSAFKRIIRG